MAAFLLSQTTITLVVLLALVLNIDLAVSSRTLKACRSCRTGGSLYARYHFSPLVKESKPAIMGNRFGNIMRRQSSRKNYSERTPAILSTRYGIITSLQNENSLKRFDNNTTRLPLIDSLGVDTKRMPLIDNTDSTIKGSKCEENRLYSDEDLVVAVSTGWNKGASRCLKNIEIEGNRHSVITKVIGEFNSGNNVVVASPGVWKALGILDLGIGEYSITWSDV